MGRRRSKREKSITPTNDPEREEPFADADAEEEEEDTFLDLPTTDGVGDVPIPTKLGRQETPQVESLMSKDTTTEGPLTTATEDDEDAPAALQQDRAVGDVVMKPKMGRQVTPQVTSDVEKKLKEEGSSTTGSLLSAMKETAASSDAASSVDATSWVQEDSPSQLVQDHAAGDVALPTKLGRQVTPQVKTYTEMKQKAGATGPLMSAMVTEGEEDDDAFDTADEGEVDTFDAGDTTSPSNTVVPPLKQGLQRKGTPMPGAMAAAPTKKPNKKLNRASLLEDSVESLTEDAPAPLVQSHAAGDVALPTKLGRQVTPQVQSLADQKKQANATGPLMVAMAEGDEEEEEEDVMDDAPAPLANTVPKFDPSEGEDTFDAAATSTPSNSVAAPPKQGLARKGTPMPGAMAAARDKTGPLVAMTETTEEEDDEEDGFDDDAPTPLANSANFDRNDDGEEDTFDAAATSKPTNTVSAPPKQSFSRKGTPMPGAMTAARDKRGPLTAMTETTEEEENGFADDAPTPLANSANFDRDNDGEQDTFDAAATSKPTNTVSAPPKQGLSRKGTPMPGAMAAARDKTGPLTAMTETTEEEEDDDEEDGFDDAPTPLANSAKFDSEEGDTFDAAATSKPTNIVSAPPKQGLSRKGTPMVGAMMAARDKTGPLMSAMTEATEEDEEEDDAPAALANDRPEFLPEEEEDDFDATTTPASFAAPPKQGLSRKPTPMPGGAGRNPTPFPHSMASDAESLSEELGLAIPEEEPKSRGERMATPFPGSMSADSAKLTAELGISAMPEAVTEEEDEESDDDDERKKRTERLATPFPGDMRSDSARLTAELENMGALTEEDDDEEEEANAKGRSRLPTPFPGDMKTDSKRLSLEVDGVMDTLTEEAEEEMKQRTARLATPFPGEMQADSRKVSLEVVMDAVSEEEEEMKQRTARLATPFPGQMQADSRKVSMESGMGKVTEDAEEEEEEEEPPTVRVENVQETQNAVKPVRLENTQVTPNTVEADKKGEASTPTKGGWLKKALSPFGAKSKQAKSSTWKDRMSLKKSSK